MKAKEIDTVNIRRMARTDIDAILALNKKIGGDQARVNYRDMISTDPGGPLDLSFVAEAGGQIVGFVLARLAYLYIPFTEVCLIHSIVVDPDYQRQKLGSRLINELESHCHLEEINTIRALVNERDTELRSFIERLGFRRSNIVNYDKTMES
ncbi:MAG: GNAT family N-acetyltransferase [Chloroflexota bacterium]